MQKRKNIILFGSLAFVFLLFGLLFSFNNVEALIFKNNSQAVQAGQQTEVVALSDTYDSRVTYDRGLGDRALAGQEPGLDGNPVTDTHEKSVDVKIRIGDSGDEILKLQQNLKKIGFFKEEPTGFFGIVTNDAVVDFQVQMGIMPDGIVGGDTLQKVEYAVNNGIVAKKPEPKVETKQASQPSAPAKTENSVQKAPSVPQPPISSGGKVELLSWFGDAENVFSIGSAARVIDVDTGTSFKIKRTYGYNHADVETMTAEDTRILKEIAGGFNWTRRAVIVEVGTRRLAASMAPMPHAGVDSKPANAQVSDRSGGYGTGDNLDAVKGNGMDGVFDIHFYNSRTHGSNKVDSNHQAMIQKAYRSGK